MSSNPSGCLGILFAPFLKKSASSKTSFPYHKRDEFLSAAEISFFHVLKNIIPADYHLITKVRLGDIFYVERPHVNQGPRAKISQKHVDFLICEAGSMTPVLAVELDDKSHQRKDRQERDAFVDRVFAAAELPLIHVPAAKGYVLNDIRQLVAGHLQFPEAPDLESPKADVAESVPPPVPSPEATFAPLEPKTPQCPKCASEMILRTASKGENKGNQFWGCSNYPRCRVVVAVKVSE